MVRRFGKFVGDADAQIQDAFLAETRNELAGFGVESDQTAVAETGINPGRPFLVALPVGDTTERGGHVVGQFIFPDFLSGLRLERDNRVMNGGGEQQAAGHDRNRFGGCQDPVRGAEIDVGGIDAILPGQLELRHIAGVDLGEPRITLAAGIAPIRRPVSLPVRSNRETARQNSNVQDLHWALRSTGGEPRSKAVYMKPTRPKSRHPVTSEPRGSYGS